RRANRHDCGRVATADAEAPAALFHSRPRGANVTASAPGGATGAKLLHEAIRAGRKNDISNTGHEGLARASVVSGKGHIGSKHLDSAPRVLAGNAGRDTSVRSCCFGRIIDALLQDASGAKKFVAECIGPVAELLFARPDCALDYVI